MAPKITLTTTPPPRTEAYLFHHRPRFGVFSGFNPFAWPVRGRPMVVLELTDETVRCTLLGTFANHPRWLQERLNMPDLKERLENGQVTVFEFPLGGYEINWPKYDFGTLFLISERGGRPWTVSFTHTRNYGSEVGTSWWDVMSMIWDAQSMVAEGAKHPIRDQWRQALNPNVGRPIEHS